MTTAGRQMAQKRGEWPIYRGKKLRPPAAAANASNLTPHQKLFGSVTPLEENWEGGRMEKREHPVQL